MKVNLRDVIEAIEYENEFLKHYYNKSTGVIIYLEDESSAGYTYKDMERIDEFEEWEQELIKELADFEKNKDDYIQLPDSTEIDELAMMREFCSETANDDLKNAASEKKDLRSIKEAIENSGLLNEWYDYRENKEYNIAVNWCNKNNIEIEADK